MKITDCFGNVLTWDEIMPTLGKNGIVYVSETDCKDFTDYLASVSKIFPHPHATGDGWTLIRPHRKTDAPPNAMGFTRTRLSPHTDRSLLHHPPSLLCFLLIERSASGGETTLVDTADIYRRIDIEELSRMQNKLWLEDSSGKRRQRIFTIEGGFCINRYRADHVAAPVARSKNAQSLLVELQKAAAHPTYIALRPGQGYVIHNHRFLHGRTEFTGSRLGARLLATVAGSPAHEWMNRGFAIHK